MYSHGQGVYRTPKPGQIRLSDYHRATILTRDSDFPFEDVSTTYTYVRYKGIISWYNRDTGYAEIKITDLPVNGVPFKELVEGTLILTHEKLCRIKMQETPDSLLAKYKVSFRLVKAVKDPEEVKKDPSPLWSLRAYDVEFFEAYCTFISCIYPTGLITVEDLEKAPIEPQETQEVGKKANEISRPVPLIAPANRGCGLNTLDDDEAYLHGWGCGI